MSPKKALLILSILVALGLLAFWRMGLFGQLIPTPGPNPSLKPADEKEEQQQEKEAKENQAEKTKEDDFNACIGQKRSPADFFAYDNSSQMKKDIKALAVRYAICSAVESRDVQICESLKGKVSDDEYNLCLDNYNNMIHIIEPLFANQPVDAQACASVSHTPQLLASCSAIVTAASKNDCAPLSGDNLQTCQAFIDKDFKDLAGLIFLDKNQDNNYKNLYLDNFQKIIDNQAGACQNLYQELTKDYCL